MLKNLLITILFTAIIMTGYNVVNDLLRGYINTHVTIEECERFTNEYKHNPEIIPD